MKSQNLHHFRSILLPFLLLVISVVATNASDRPPKTKSELISALNKMEGERFTDEQHLEAILAGLDRLTDQEKRDTAVHKALHLLAYRLNLEEFTAEAKQLVFKKIEFRFCILHIWSFVKAKANTTLGKHTQRSWKLPTRPVKVGYA